MDHYLEIRLLPDPEFPPNILINALFSKLHRGLAAYGEGAIGVSFPDVREGRPVLGQRLRLHGNGDHLHGFAQTNWLVGIRDHITLQNPAPVPAGARHRIVRRVQTQSSPERLRRRLIARKGISSAEALAAIPDACAERLDLPFVIVTSRSTGQQFPLFIEHLLLQDHPAQGIFSAYGLSTTATVPWF